MINETKMEKDKEKQAVQDINLNYIFNLVQHIISSANQAAEITDNFIKQHGAEQLAKKIYQDKEAATEAARILGEVSKLKSAYFAGQTNGQNMKI